VSSSRLVSRARALVCFSFPHPEVIRRAHTPGLDARKCDTRVYATSAAVLAGVKLFIPSFPLLYRLDSLRSLRRLRRARSANPVVPPRPGPTQLSLDLLYSFTPFLFFFARVDLFPLECDVCRPLPSGNELDRARLLPRTVLCDRAKPYGAISSAQHSPPA